MAFVKEKNVLSILQVATSNFFKPPVATRRHSLLAFLFASLRLWPLASRLPDDPKPSDPMVPGPVERRPGADLITVWLRATLVSLSLFFCLS